MKTTLIARKFTQDIDFPKQKPDVNPLWSAFSKELRRILAEIKDDPELLTKCYTDARIRRFDEEFLPSLFATRELKSAWELKSDDIERLLREIMDSTSIVILG